MNADQFRARLRAMQQQRTTEHGIARETKIAFMSAVCDLFDAMNAADLHFPIGKAPSRPACLSQLRQSVGSPAIYFNIDVRRTARVSCRELGDPAVLYYVATLLDCNIPHGQELVTGDIDEVGNWLLHHVVPLACSQPPTRSSDMYKLLGGPPGMATADDTSLGTTPPPPPDPTQPPARESRRVRLD